VKSLNDDFVDRVVVIKNHEGESPAFLRRFVGHNDAVLDIAVLGKICLQIVFGDRLVTNTAHENLAHAHVGVHLAGIFAHLFGDGALGIDPFLVDDVRTVGHRLLQCVAMTIGHEAETARLSRHFILHDNRIYEFSPLFIILVQSFLRRFVTQTADEELPVLFVDRRHREK